MRTHIIKISFIAAFSLIVGFNIYQSQKKIELPAIALDNIEALANGEVIVGPWYCAGSGYCYDPESEMVFDGTKYNN